VALHFLSCKVEGLAVLEDDKVAVEEDFLTLVNL
jgi:hypothetical protein